MRPSQRTRILDAAIRVTERDGITALTLESAAEEAGVTKGGLMYHFRTREELLVAIQRHLTDAWEAQLVAELGKPLADASPQEAVEAYVRVGAHGLASKADLAFMVESVTTPALAEAWDDLIGRWAPPPTSTDPRDIDLLLAQLAVDGLWLWRATSMIPLSEPVRKALHDRLLKLVAAEDADAG